MYNGIQIRYVLKIWHDVELLSMHSETKLSY